MAGYCLKCGEGRHEIGECPGNVVAQSSDESSGGTKRTEVEANTDEAKGSEEEALGDCENDEQHNEAKPVCRCCSVDGNINSLNARRTGPVSYRLAFINIVSSPGLYRLSVHTSNTDFA